MEQKNKIIRVLHVIGQMGCGGAEAMLMNLYRNIDRSKIQFDFVVHTTEKCFYDDEILELGGKIYSVEKYTVTNFFSYKKWWNNFFEKFPEYTIIHGHINSSAAIYLSLAKKYGRIAVVHSHATKNVQLTLRSSAFSIMAYPIRYIADYFFGCSIQAGKDRFGCKIAHSDRFMVLKNGIDPDRFVFSKASREHNREKYGVSDSTVVIGHVGRFTAAKNHEFLLKVYRCFVEKHPNSVLWLVGQGEKEQEIKNWIQQYDIQDKVYLMGVSETVQDYLNAMDVFIFPSIFEGLGIALVEAQATGLPCIVSENIQPEADIGAGLVTQLNLKEDSCDKWVLEIEKRSSWKREDTKRYVNASGFNVQKSALQLQNFYLSLGR